MGHPYRFLSPERTRAILAGLQGRAQQSYVSPLHLACLSFELKEDDKGFALLDAAFAVQDQWLCFLGSMPAHDHIQNDPRLTAFLNKFQG